ncbi:MAG: ANTAR domain-containing protein [Actinoallomurus sp.]
MEPLPETDEALNEYLEEDDVDLREVLTTMAREARDIVPSCVGLSLGLVRDGLTFTLVATAAEVAAIDAAQYLEGGPCVDVAGGADVLDLDVADLLDEGRWTAFARASAVRGVESSLSLQVVKNGEVVGGINLYAAQAGAFNGKHDRLASALGTSADGAVTNADLQFETREVARRAPQALADVRTVDVAVGMLAARHHIDVSAARERLEGAAMRAGISVLQAAAVVIASHQN